MAELKTKKNAGNVNEFVASIADPNQQKDAKTLIALMRRVTGEKPVMWGATMIGFGTHHYTYASGREGDWFVIGFSPRKRTTTLYILDGFDEYQSLLSKLGKHSTSKSCLYIKKLDDIDIKVLEQLLKKSVAAMRRKSPTS
jgi:hypothetical protein